MLRWTIRHDTNNFGDARELLQDRDAVSLTGPTPRFYGSSLSSILNLRVQIHTLTLLPLVFPPPPVLALRTADQKASWDFVLCYYVCPCCTAYYSYSRIYRRFWKQDGLMQLSRWYCPYESVFIY
jgi:hypothetical protein